MPIANPICDARGRVFSGGGGVGSTDMSREEYTHTIYIYSITRRDMISSAKLSFHLLVCARISLSSARMRPCAWSA